MAVAGIGNINAACCGGGNELNRDGSRRYAAFVTKDVHVVATGIDEPAALSVDVRLAVRIVSVIARHRSFRHNNQAVSRVRVPTGASSRLPGILLDVKV